MITTIVDGSFFSSEENGVPIEPGTQIDQPLPKMLPQYKLHTDFSKEADAENLAKIASELSILEPI